MRKKINIAMLTILLVFQTFIGPLSVFAEEDLSSLPPAEDNNAGTEQKDTTSGGDTGEGIDSGEDDSATTSGDTADVQLPTVAPLNIGPLAAPANMQGDVAMSFTGLKLFNANGALIDESNISSYSGPKPKKGDTVYLLYKFHVTPGQDYGIGSTFTFQLPANMIEEFTSGSFNVTRDTPYANYSSSYNSMTKTVTVTLNSEIEVAQAGDINFEFTAKFGNFASEEELEQTLVIPIEGGATVNLPFEFAPTGSGNLLTKSAGTIARAANGTVTIPWTVWINTGGQKLNGASLNDVPDAKHALTGNITVERYKVGLNGFNPNSPGIPDATNNSATAFPINLTDGNYAYKVTYNTIVTADPTNSSMQYTNVATLTGTGIPANTTASGTQTVQYGPSLDKTRAGDKYKSTWTIKYNWLGQKIPANQATLTDALTGQHPTTGKHKIDYTSFSVYRVTLSNDGQTEQSSTLLTKGTDYTLTENNYNFVLNFDRPSNTTGPNGEVTSAFKIVYDTELEGEFVTEANQGTVTNTVTRGDTGADTATIGLTPGIFNKSRSTIDYVNKTIEWTLTINAEKELRNFVIEDEFTTNNKVGDTLKHTLTQWSGSEFYHVTGIAPTAYTITDKTGNAPAVGNEGFKVEFTSSIPAGSTVTIRYKTKYDIKPNGGVATAYINTADATWDGVTSTSNQALNRTDNYTPNQDSPTNNNGYKRVSVDNNTQEFSWGIGVNINKQDIEGATLADTLGAGHYIPVPDGQLLKDQIKIFKLNLTTEEGTKDGELDAARWSVTETVTDGKVTGFVITFASLDNDENNEAYLIEYTTKDADDIYGQSSGDARQYTNEAVLDTPHNGDYTYNATATISNRANELITKSANAVPAQDVINWTVTVNASNSQLGNITLTDKPSANQKILTNSFRKQEIKLNEAGVSQNVGSAIVIDENDVVLNPDGSFSLDLGELNGKGYIVTYSTFFMGDGNAGETVSNEASIGYAGASAAGTTDSNDESAFFQYSSSDSDASPLKGTLQLKKFKVNPLTGVREEFEGVTFELWNKNNTVKLDEGVTDVDGLLVFEDVRYGKYTLREAQPSGYDVVVPFVVTLNADLDVSRDGKAYVVENIESVTDPNACPKFAITVNDANGNPIGSGKDITLFNSNGDEVAQGSTDSNGQFTVKRPGTGGSETAVKAGLYTVEVKDGVDTIVLENAEITVKYGADCEVEVQQVNACPSVTITINDDNNNPRPNVTVILKDSNNATIATETTGNDGKFTLPSTTPAGTYKVYEGNQYLGTVEIDYTSSTPCEAELAVARACETFTLTINDRDGKPRENVDIEIVDKQDSNTRFTGTTNADGEVVFDNLPATGLPPADYVVYEDGVTAPLDEFTVDTDCEYTVQPIPACPAFTLTIENEDGPLKAGTKVVIENKDTHVQFEATVEADGRITFATNQNGERYTIAPGDYTVVSYEIEPGKSVSFGEDFEVTYTTADCKDEVTKPRGCTEFEITVIGPDGTTPKANAKVIVEDEHGVETEYTTDGDGKITLPSTQQPGKVVVYEVNPDGSKGERIDEVTVTYTDNCKGTVIKNSCPQFTLTVNNKDNQPVGANVKIVMKDKAGVTVVTGATDANGQITVGDKAKLEQGKEYDVYNEAGILLGNITVSYTDEVCGAEVKVPENACPLFTLTIQDVNGNPRKEVAFVIKNNAGNTIATGTTDAEGKATVPYTVEPGNYVVVVGTESPLAITVQDCAALAKPVPAPPGGGGGGGGGTPPTPEVPVTPPTPEKPTVPEEPTTPPTPEEPTVPEEPTTPPTTPEKPTTPPAVEEVIKKIPEIPGIVPVPPTPGSEDPVRYEVPNIPQIVEELSKNPAKLQQTIQELEAFVKQYEALSPEEQAYVDELVNMDLVRSLLHELQQAANVLGAANNNQNKLPQTNDADQTAAIFAGIVLVALGFVLLRRRFTTAEK